MMRSRRPKEQRPTSQEVNTDKSNSNITAKRVTLVSGYLTRACRSKVAQKSPGEDDGNVLENLLRDSPPRLRRSDRLSKKNTPEVRSKSIFKEIKEKYAQAQRGRQSRVLANEDFWDRITRRLLPTFTLKDAGFYRKKILDEILTVDNTLTGKLRPFDMSLNRKRQYSLEEEKENVPVKFPYIPQENWVFQTPPNRKLQYNHTRIEEGAIQPAVVEVVQQGKVVYEMDKKINVDLSHFGDKQEVNIDRRYMVPVATVNPVGDVFEGRGQPVHFMETSPVKKYDVKDPYELEHYFLSLTCRPKKATQTCSRIAHWKRRRERSEPGCSTDPETENEFEANFSLIEHMNTFEESFTFQFTSSECSNATTAHIFDYGGSPKDTFNFRIEN